MLPSIALLVFAFSDFAPLVQCH